MRSYTYSYLQELWHTRWWVSMLVSNQFYGNHNCFIRGKLFQSCTFFLLLLLPNGYAKSSTFFLPNIHIKSRIEIPYGKFIIKCIQVFLISIPQRTLLLVYHRGVFNRSLWQRPQGGSHGWPGSRSGRIKPEISWHINLQYTWKKIIGHGSD